MSTRTQVNTDSVQTLSNKTLTAPIINAGVCGADPTTSLGIATQQYVLAQLSVLFPTGIQVPFGGSAAPSGFLACDGSAVSRTTYAALFAVIGTTYGVGDGSTTFNVPDKRGRTSLGAGTGTGLTARTRGTNGGEETHLLTGVESGQKNVTGTATVSQEDSQSSTVRIGGVSNFNGTVYGVVSGISIPSSNASVAHNTMMPYQVDLWIIKT